MPTLEQWHTTWNALGARAPDDGLYATLAARYTEAHRHYHTLQHLDECLANLGELRAAARRPEEVEIALWFHDAIYDVHRRDSEERSAQWARESILAAGLPESTAGRVHALIMATRHEAQPHDADACVLVDVDLWILGAGTARFDEYDAQVRAEYRWVPDLLFRPGRAKVLRGFLARPRIYLTELFHARHEAAARTNLMRSLALLER